MHHGPESNQEVKQAKNEADDKTKQNQSSGAVCSVFEQNPGEFSDKHSTHTVPFYNEVCRDGESTLLQEVNRTRCGSELLN